MLQQIASLFIYLISNSYSSTQEKKKKNKRKKTKKTTTKTHAHRNYNKTRVKTKLKRASARRVKSEETHLRFRTQVVIFLRYSDNLSTLAYKQPFKAAYIEWCHAHDVSTTKKIAGHKSLVGRIVIARDGWLLLAGRESYTVNGHRDYRTECACRLCIH